MVARRMLLLLLAIEFAWGQHTLAFLALSLTHKAREIFRRRTKPREREREFIRQRLAFPDILACLLSFFSHSYFTRARTRVSAKS